MFQPEFQPELTLLSEPDGSFRLDVRVLVPDSCYRAGDIRTGTPSGAITLPEALPFTFEIARSDGPCTQVEQWISASKAGLRPGAGHQSVVMFTTLDGKILGQGAIAFPPPETMKMIAKSGGPRYPIVPGSTSAVVTSDLIGQHTTLKVGCVVATPTPGFRASLRPLKPSGINPRILLLELVVDPPIGQAIDVLSTVTASYKEEDYHGHYTDVSIVNMAQIVTVPVIVLMSAFNPAQRHDFSVMRTGLN